MGADWKEHHANEAGKALDNEMVQHVLTEFAGNMGFKRAGLPEYGMTKIVLTVAAIARAEALGFDPELLRLTPGEADEELLKKARIAAESGKPVWVIGGSDA